MEIITNKECQYIIASSLEKAYDAIKCTLGPKGANAIVKLNGNTIVTNDGVSILKELKLNGCENIPLKIIKEACFNSEKKSGDGTTTSIVLTHAIYNEGIKYNKNKVVLLKEIKEACDKVIEFIKSESQPIRNFEDIKNIATISTGGNKRLGNIISEAFKRVGFKGNVELELNPNSEEITTEFVKGFILKSDYLLQDNINENFKRCHFLIYEGKIEKISDLNSLAMFCREKLNNEPLVLISNFTKEALEGIFLYNNSGTRILPYSLPMYGNERITAIQELKFITNANTISKDYQFIDFELKDFELATGHTNNCIVKKSNILIKDISEEKLKQLLEYRLNTNKDKATELENGIATIYVGAKTKVEAEETLLRIEDAINSVKLALIDGIVIGGANLLANISFFHNEENTDGETILFSAMSEPIKIILENAGLDTSNGIENITKDLTNTVKFTENIWNVGINAETLQIEDLLKTGVIDPTTTVINSLQSAVSIATALLNIKTIITED